MKSVVQWDLCPFHPGLTFFSEVLWPKPRQGSSYHCRCISSSTNHVQRTPLFPPPAQNPKATRISSHFPLLRPKSPPSVLRQFLSFPLPSIALRLYLFSLNFPIFLPHQPKQSLIYTNCPSQLPPIPSCFSSKNSPNILLTITTLVSLLPSLVQFTFCQLPSFPNTKYLNPIESTFPKTKMARIQMENYKRETNARYRIVSQLFCLCNLEAILYNPLVLTA